MFNPFKAIGAAIGWYCEAIGRFTAWYPIQLPFVRRLARSNPRDFGKFFLLMWIMSIIQLVLRMKRDDIMAKWLGAPETLPSMDDVLKPLVNEAKDLDMFRKRFGELHGGDEVIFTTGDEHISGVFAKWQDNKLIVQGPNGERFVVDKQYVLDVTPAF